MIASMETEERRRFDVWLRKRTERAVVGMVVLTVLGVVAVVVAPVGLVFALLHHRMARALERRGVLVPATLLTLEDDANVSDAATFFQTMGSGIPEGAPRVFHAMVAALTPAVLFAARYVPALPVRYRFELDGRVIETGRYMFAHERFHRDAAGGLRVRVDPKHPRLNTWLVSSLD